MCGRYTNATTWAEVHAAATPLPMIEPEAPPGIELNIAPTALAWVLRPDAEGVLRAARLRWGLVPAWSETSSTKFSSFNARVESVAEKPVFRGAFRTRRCLVPASGWYEWREEAGRKVPHLFEPAAGGALLFAGLWERWQRGDAAVESFTILTCDARGQVAEVHDRMPVLVAHEQARHWLDLSLLEAEAFALSLQTPVLKVERGRAPPASPRRSRSAPLPEQPGLF
ncbi:SOS response-associated peptidase [Aquimonas voraii]|uniref:Abasic site processing protein n=1 Tax=Aquimonas voraii TaxID=265719 RepID=A0A1G6Y0T6_9GAMM|nr:SOS response-associated peptidase [Aquimonas voraii]SDD84084.1 Putative SOS response-associated peptidase YedK [Aquimonas voraii]